MRTVLERPKCANACTYCRTRKIRCTGGAQCRNCTDHGRECVYPIPLRRRRRPDPGLEDRLARVEAMLKGETQTAALGFEDGSETPSEMQWAAGNQLQTLMSLRSMVRRDHRNPDVGSLASQGDMIEVSSHSPSTHYTVSTEVLSPYSTPSDRQNHNSVKLNCISEMIESRDDPASYFDSEESQPDKEDFIVAPQKINWEHHGPTSWLSICSDPGISWVTERTGGTDFAKYAKGLTTGWTRRLSMNCGVVRERAPEVDAATAWKYSRAYFEDSYDAVFGVVCRPAFEARLQKHFEEDSLDDPSWYAIRHIIYASGCRILLSKDPSTSFVEAQKEAWKHFENALSVHMELLHTPTGLPAVQALALMTFYVEGLGSPSLEYMFSSSAARLAQAKGLHRQAARSWNLPESEILHRNWLWWAIYCCDKHIAKRSGRPSAIDDYDISCQIPTKKVAGSTIDVEFFTTVARHAQISSQISRLLGSAKTFQRTLPEVLETVVDLSAQLESWYASSPARLTPRLGLHSNYWSTITRFDHLMYVHNAYHGSLMAIHTIFTYPWISAFFGRDSQTPTLRSQVTSSTEIVAEAARKIILTTRYIEIDAASRHWLSFSYPMFGLINLFICVLKNPTSSCALSDLALMDMVAGHFAHMELVTASELSFPFTREVAALARRTVLDALENRAGSGQISTPAPSDFAAGLDVDLFGNLDMIDLDMESWNVFSSVVMDGD